MKRIISILLVLCTLSVLLVSCGSSSDDGNKQELNSQYSIGLAFEVSENNPNECIITGIGSCTDKNIVVPPYINGMKVVGVKDGAFSPKTQEVALGVKVGEFVASDVTDTMLENTDGEESVSSATDSNVSSGSNSVVIFDKIQSGIHIENSANNPIFSVNGSADSGVNYEVGTNEPIELTEIESIQIPYTVTQIGEEAFYGCEDLATINTHGAISSIGKDAFKETAYYNNPQNWENGQVLYLKNYLISVSTNFTGELTVKDGTTTVADQAFYNCTYLTTVNMADSVKTVGNFAFYGCTNLVTYNYSTSTNITYAAGVFDGCVNFKYELFAPNGTAPSPDTDEISSRYPTEFDKVTSEQFNAIKENRHNSYTVEITNNQSNEKKMIYVDYANRQYNLIQDGNIVKEVYSDSFNTYMYVGNNIYPTTFEIPDAMEILNELEYEHLGIYDAKANTYAYLMSEGEANRIEFGFKDGDKLVYIKTIIDGEEITTYFYDFNATSIRGIDKSMIDNSITVDANGNPIN